MVLQAAPDHITKQNLLALPFPPASQPMTLVLQDQVDTVRPTRSVPIETAPSFIHPFPPKHYLVTYNVTPVTILLPHIHIQRS